MSRIAAAMAAPPVYAAEGPAGTSRSTGDAEAGIHPVVLTRIVLLLAGAVMAILLLARGAWLLLPAALLPLAILAWLASHYAGRRTASWAVLALSLFAAGPFVLVLLASLR